MTPVVRVWSKPNGSPMAKTFLAHLCRSLEVPEPRMGGSRRFGALIFSTARSLSARCRDELGLPGRLVRQGDPRPLGVGNHMVVS